MQIDNGWINVRSLYQYRHVDSTVLYVDMSLSKLCRDISTLSDVDKSTTYHPFSRNFEDNFSNGLFSPLTNVSQGL